MKGINFISKPAISAGIVAILVILLMLFQTPDFSQSEIFPTSIYVNQITVIPHANPVIPTMKIVVDEDYSGKMSATKSPTPVKNFATPLTEPNQPVKVSSLALPFDPDEIAVILKNNPRLQFRYKHRAFVFPNCSTLTHLGEIMEIYANFNEGDKNAPPPPEFSIYAPADMRIIKIWGTSRTRLVMNSRIGITEEGKPLYLSILTLTQLRDSLAGKLANLLGVQITDLQPDYSKLASSVGPFSFSSEYLVDVDDPRSSNHPIQTTSDSILIRKGEKIGVKSGPWEWHPLCDTEHTLSVHVFPTTNDVNDQNQAVETFVPDITYHYLNMVVREMVIKRGLTIDVQYRTRNVGTDHALLARELFAPDVIEKVTLIPWLIDRHPHRFTVTPLMENPIVYDDEKE